VKKTLAGLLVVGIVFMAASTPLPAQMEGSNVMSRVVGYFVQWGIYSRNYRVKDVVTSGAAEKLTHLNYAFANVSTDFKCYEETRAGWGDSYADYEVPFTADQSVDGQADPLNKPLYGNFNQLKKLKAMYPKLKVLISIGGWSWSGRFSDAALPEHRVDFVKSCIDVFIRGNLPIFPGTKIGGKGAAAGLFDGIDIDWEYPAAPGFPGDPTRNLPPNVYRPEDTQNFTALLAEFRKQLNEIGAETGKNYLLTIAAPAGQEQYSKMELDKIHPYLDFINVMTYDMHTAADATGPTNFNAPLYASPDDPSPEPASVDGAISAYLKAGIPADKVVMGIPFYGHGWTNVPNQNNGLYQKDAGMEAARGTFEAGTEDYKVLKKRKSPSFRDPKTGSFWIFDGKTFWSYDDPEAIAQKMQYAKNKGLGGAMFWSLDGDDGTLIKAIYDNLK